MPMSYDEACAAVCAPGTMFEITETDVRGHPTKVFAAAPPNIRSLFEMAALRESEFVIYEDERWTMPDVLALAAQIGHAMAETWGVNQGDRVAIAMRNYPEWIAAYAAIGSIGAVAVPLNAWWKHDELQFALDDSGASLVFADDARLTQLLAGGSAPTASLVAVRARTVLPDGVHRLEDALVEGASMP